MIEEVKICVDEKIKFFDNYFSVPDDLQADLNLFINDTINLGERCSSASEFEQQFSTSGLLDRFNTLISKCIPKAKKMTKEEKKQSIKITKDILYENREELAKDALKDTTNRIINDKRDEMLDENRKRMIEEGTYADYTIMKNNMERINGIGNFLGNIFRNKKDKK